MVPVALQPVPNAVEFDSKIASPGRSFLAKNSAPKGKEWNNHDYWRRAIPWMQEAYGQVCQYSSHWIASDTGANSIEHFDPKDTNPSRAYEWNNFRLVCGRLNGRRGTKKIVDPFSIPAGLFEIVFPALLVKVASDHPADLTRLANATIKTLGLNDENTCVRNRKNWFDAYKSGDVTFAFLQRCAPFLAGEMQRQGQIT